MDGDYYSVLMYILGTIDIPLIVEAVNVMVFIWDHILSSSNITSHE